MASETKTSRSRRTRAALVTATREQLSTTGNVTAESAAAQAGCAPGTFWVHFGTKDEAILAAYSAALDELIGLTAHLFADVPPAGSRERRRRWSAHVIDRLVEYFAKNSLLLRVAIARTETYPAMKVAFRAAEERTIELVNEGLQAGMSRADAEAVVVFCQGLNNPVVVRSRSGGRVRKKLAAALNVLSSPLAGSRARVASNRPSV